MDSSPPQTSASRLALLAAATLAPGAACFAMVGGQVLLRGHSVTAAVVAATAIVFVGVVGLAPLFGGGPRGLPPAAVAWTVLVWLGLPLFTDDPPEDAFLAGVAAARGDAPTPTPVGTLQLPAPEPLGGDAGMTVAAPPPEGDPDSTVVVLPYEGDGRRMRVPVTLVGPRGEVKTWMLFDTGATFTTLDEATLDRLGVPPAGGPELTLNTAAGEVTTTLALIDRVWLEDSAAEGVSVAVCNDCASDDYSGLLGLNVTGRYKTSIDHETGEVELTPLPVDDRTVDVSRWLDLSGRARTYPGVKTQVEVTGRNLSSRPILEAVASVRCRGGEVAVQLDDIGPGSEATSRIDLPGDLDCDRFRLELLSARW